MPSPLCPPSAQVRPLFWAWVILFLLALICGMPGAIAQPTIQSEIYEDLDPTAVIADLASVSVVYLGETHDQAADHVAQLEIIEAIFAQQPDLAIGLEMVQRPFQAALDQFLTGEISEADFRMASEYDQRWGFEWEFYAPILRFAQTHQRPVIALNTPTEVTRQVAQSGVESLTAADQTYIPPRAELDFADPDYRAYLEAIYADFHVGLGVSDGFERFFQAQVLWDETMAMAIAQHFTTQPNPPQPLIVLVGSGHLVHGLGLPSRVARRLSPHKGGDRPDFAQRTVIINPQVETEPEFAHLPPLADYLWRTE